MNFRRKLKINWLLWGCISIPIFVVSWLQPHDVKGTAYSDIGYLVSWLKQTNWQVNHGIWNFFLETMLWSAGPALLVGWLIQYFIVWVWDVWRERSVGRGGTRT
jgi:hypothetical protein